MAVPTAMPAGPQVLWSLNCALCLQLRVAHCVLRVHQLNSSWLPEALLTTLRRHKAIFMQPDLPILLSLPRPRIVNDHVLEETPPCHWTLWAKRGRNSAGGTCMMPVSQTQRKQQRQNAPFKSMTFSVFAPRTGLGPVESTCHRSVPSSARSFFLRSYMWHVGKIFERQCNKYVSKYAF